MLRNFTRSLIRIRHLSSQTEIASAVPSFRSKYSLDKLYPQSSLDITTAPKVPQNENGKFSGFIPLERLDIQYSRSSGPGGQNVNCVSTKVDLRFHLETADWIPDGTRPLLAKRAGNQINKDGFLVIKSDRTRSQQLNLADCLDKVRKIIYSAEASTPELPTAAALELGRRRQEKAARQRLQQKRMQSITKQGRQTPDYE
nr:EOG090X0JCO [Lepidurus arcticus]